MHLFCPSQEERKERQQRQEAEAQKADAKSGTASGHSLEAMRDAFEACDEDGSGEIDAGELVQAMHAMGEVVTLATCKEMVEHLDKDGSGTLGFAEFVSMMTGGELQVAPLSTLRRIDTLGKYANEIFRSACQSQTRHTRPQVAWCISVVLYFPCVSVVLVLPLFAVCFWFCLRRRLRRLSDRWVTTACL